MLPDALRALRARAQEAETEAPILRYSIDDFEDFDASDG